MSSRQNVNGVADRPGGVAPWSDTFAAAHTISSGKRPLPSTCDTRSGMSYGHSRTLSGPSRRTKNAELSRRR